MCSFQGSDLKDLPGSQFAASLSLAAAQSGKDASAPPGSAFPGLTSLAGAFQPGNPFGLPHFMADPRLPFGGAFRYVHRNRNFFWLLELYALVLQWLCLWSLGNYNETKTQLVVSLCLTW